MEYDEHVSVLSAEVLDFMQPQAGGRYIDGTVGAGGHTASLLAASAPDGRVLAFDRDPEALAYTRRRLGEAAGARVTFVQTPYSRMAELGPAHGFSAVDGILLDLGLSSRQLADAERGFSFKHDGPLDMRFDPTQGKTAADLLNNLPEQELAGIFWRYGEVRQNRKLARAVVHGRPLHTTGQLADLVVEVIGGRRRHLHPATLVFQALRIAVNDELAEIEAGLTATLDLLKPGGRLAVISFHSLEDRIVKRFIREAARECVCPPAQPICTCDTQPQLRPVTRKVVRPSEEEVAANPRSRSARLRVAERLAPDPLGGANLDRRPLVSSNTENDVY